MGGLYKVRNNPTMQVLRVGIVSRCVKPALASRGKEEARERCGIRFNREESYLTMWAGNGGLYTAEHARRITLSSNHSISPAALAA